MVVISSINSNVRISAIDGEVLALTLLYNGVIAHITGFLICGERNNLSATTNA